MGLIMTDYTYDMNSFSDLHKDIYGFRPSAQFYEWLRMATEDELQAQWDDMCARLEFECKRERQLEEEAAEKFEQLVAQTIDTGAGDRQTALRWIMDASDCDGDWEYLCYHHGLRYGYFKEMQ